MPSIYSSHCRRALWLAIFLFSLLCQGQNAMAQWWKDTVWTRDTYVNGGFYMLKFSKNDSIIVGHGIYDKSFFYDAATGKDIGWIWGNNEIHFINNDRNFIRTSEKQTQIEIFDSRTYLVIDTIENDGKIIGKIDISNDERFIIGVVSGGLRTWNIQTKKIQNTKMFPDEENLTSIGIGHLKLNCTNNRMIGQFAKSYYNPSNPKYPINVGYFGVYDANTLDSVDFLKNGQYFTLSNTCKYIAYKVGDPYNGVEIYDFNTKQLLWKIPVNGPSLTGLEFSPDDKYLVTAPTIMIWDIEKNEKKYQYASGSSNNIALSQDGKYIVNSIGGFMVKFPARWDGDSVNEPYEPERILYPNPSTGVINLGFKQKDSGQTVIDILDISGKTLKTIYDNFLNSGEHNIPLNVGWLSPGSYYLTIRNQSTIITFKLIINK